MTTSSQESYWRIYLLLHEGCPLIFKQLIEREIEKSGGDIDALLLKNKKQLCKVLSTLDVDVLFPGSKKTDIDKWNTDIFPCVILTLFSKTLQQVEKQLIRRIQNVQDDIEELPEISLDRDAYDDLQQTLSKTLQKFAQVVSNDTEMVTKIDELVKVFIKKPLNFADLLAKMSKSNLPMKTQQKLKVFIEEHDREANTNSYVYERTRDAQTSVKEEDRSLNAYGTSRSSTNVSVEAQTDLDETHKLEHATGGSDEICRGSEDVTTHNIDNASRIIVQNVQEGLTEQEVSSTMLLWRSTDFRKNVNDKSFDDISKNKLEDWEKVRVKVAVLGRTGVGKSRFINAIRGCTSKKDPLYAKVGYNETTTKAECYPHPKNRQLELYDLPGTGTDKFPRETFIVDDRIKFLSYDIYLIMATDRFTTDETFFANCLEQYGKKYLFVRTRVDINLEDVDDEKAAINEMRANCVEKLGGMTIKATDVFLISSKYFCHPLLDFDRLIERLVYSLPALKKEAMMFALQFNTKELIDEKWKALKSRTLIAGLKSAAGGAIPIPGVSLICDLLLVTRELDFYRKTLGVTENDLQDLAVKTKTDVDKLKRKYKLKSFDVCKISTNDITNPGVQFTMMFKALALSEAVESSVKLLPAIGSAMGAGVSFATTVHFLRSNLKLMVGDAKTMMDILLEETGIKVSGVK